MITPKIALSKLSALRERERMFHVVWGVVRWLSLALTLVVIACLIDWRIDRSRETPMWARAALFGVQLLALGIAGWVWLVRPWSRGPALIPLARRVEEHFPEFDHRLITSIQLTHTDARTQGMSAQLIENLTEETERISQKHGFVQLADARRLKWSAGLLLWPLGVVAFAMVFFGPALWMILLQRQLLGDAEVPRKHHLVNLTPRVFPAGDVVVVRYEVTGPIDERENKDFGFVRIYPEGKSSEDYPVEFEKRIDDNHTVFKAHVLQSSLNFEHRAWIADGRSRRPSDVVFEARPEITIGAAEVEMPSYVPLRPDSTRYSTTFPYGDVKGLEGSKAHVQLMVQKPFVHAVLMVYARDKNGREILADRLPIPGPYQEVEIDGSKKYVAKVGFELTPKMTAYRGEVWDANDFANDLSKTPRRTIEIQPDQPPVVTLLADRYVIPDVDDDVPSGLPTPLGRTIPVGYTCRSPIGLAKLHETKKGTLIAPAYIVFRVNDGKWTRIPCREVPQTEQSGPYHPQTASFENVAYQRSVLNNNVMFHANPASDPMKEVPRQYGGGRYDLQTDTMRKITPEGKSAELESGDRVEIYVEVFDSKDQMGRTIDTRTVDMCTSEEYTNILIKTQQNEDKLRELTKLQQGTFSLEKK